MIRGCHVETIELDTDFHGASVADYWRRSDFNSDTDWRTIVHSWVIVSALTVTAMAWCVGRPTNGALGRMAASTLAYPVPSAARWAGGDAGGRYPQPSNGVAVGGSRHPQKFVPLGG